MSTRHINGAVKAMAAAGGWTGPQTVRALEPRLTAERAVGRHAVPHTDRGVALSDCAGCHEERSARDAARQAAWEANGGR